MFIGWQVMNGVHGDNSIEGFFFKRQVCYITDHKKTVIADPLASFTQGLN